MVFYTGYIVYAIKVPYDISESWAEFYIMDAIAKRHMSVYQDGSFNPDGLIIVSDALTVIPRLVAKKYQNWFFANTITKPADGRKFFMDNRLIAEDEFLAFDRPITREELAYLLIRASKLMPNEAAANFSDYNLISMDKRGYVNRINYIGVLNGSDNKFNPLSSMTRAEFCVVISRMGELKVPEDKIVPAELKPRVVDLPVPILLYHSITDSEELAASDDMYITIQKLTEDLTLINSLGYTPIFAKDLDKELPPKPIVITFDDGYLTNYAEAFPIFKKMNMKMTIFLNGYTGEMAGYEHKFTWKQAKEMIDSNVIDIQSHTYALHSIDYEGTPMTWQQQDENEAQYIARIEKDCETHNNNFKAHLGYAPTVFAYPYGLANEATEKILSKYYKSTLTTYPIVANPKYGLFLLPRVTVTQSTLLDFLTE